MTRPDRVEEAFFDLPLLPDEMNVRPNAELGLKLTHLLREQAQQHWWKAEWPEFTWLAGYALTSQSAIEILVRAIRRFAAEPGQLPEDVRTQFARVCERVGIAILH